MHLSHVEMVEVKVSGQMASLKRGGAGSEARRATCQQPARHVQVVTSAAPTDALDYA